MQAFDAFILDGRVTLVALFVLAAEVLLVVALRRRSDTLTLLANGLSGISLIMALRAALLGPDPTVVALWMAVGFVAHLTDLVQRLRR